MDDIIQKIYDRINPFAPRTGQYELLVKKKKFCKYMIAFY